MENMQHGGFTRVVLFTSRNKDNKELEGFKQRNQSFISKKSDTELIDLFKLFSEKGVQGETSRMYISINERDNRKIVSSIQHILIDFPDYDITNLNSKMVSIASKKEHSVTNRWLLDIDISDKADMSKFLCDFDSYYTDSFDMHKTLNNYAIVVSHGFDTRELINRWGDMVEVKKDGMLCKSWYTK